MDERTRRRYLGLCATAAGAALAGCSDLAALVPGGETNDGTSDRKIDDWQYTPSRSGGDGGGGGGVAYSAQASAGSGDSVGLAAGGGKDVATFRRNVREGKLPLPESLSYEGLFYNYYFETGGGGSGSCDSLFCPRYGPAVTPDPLSGETERYLSVGLDSGLAKSEFERKNLNLVVVLDTSGSMSSEFDEYYYDQYGNKQTPEGDTDRSKMAVAKDALVTLTEQLRAGDRLGIVLYDNSAAVAKPLRPVAKTDMGAIREHIRTDIEAGGGTNLEAGLDEATAMLQEYAGADPAKYENRAIVLTDAMPNIGKTSAGGLRGILADNAQRGLHTTVVGVGLDFNAELVDRITAIKGANYYSVHSAEEFERRMGEEFAYMVTPLVYDLSLELDAEGFDIRKVYGSSVAEEATGRLMQVKTLFPSPKKKGKAKGGVVLVQVDRQSADETMRLRSSWRTRTGSEQSAETTISFPSGEDEQFAHSGVRKAVLLSRYADLLKNWMIHARDGDAVTAEGGIEVPPEEYLGRWEQQSEPLTVSPEYAARIREFRTYYASEARAIGDDALRQELTMLDTILEAA